MTKAELQQENQRLRDRIDELQTRIDALSEPAQSLMEDVSLACEQLESEVTHAIADFKEHVKGLLSGVPA